jgi:hypothetical protein
MAGARTLFYIQESDPLSAMEKTLANSTFCNDWIVGVGK